MKKSVPKRKGRPGQLTIDQVEHLIEGDCVSACKPWFGKPGFPFESEEARKKVWVMARDTILKMVFDTSPFNYLDGKPGLHAGTRPAAWWQYDAPKELRRQMKGDPVEPVEPQRPYMGISCPWNVRVYNAEFESQFAYLQRHKLLLPKESEFVKVDQMRYENV